jgi:hypothetical protein
MNYNWRTDVIDTSLRFEIPAAYPTPMKRPNKRLTVRAVRPKRTDAQGTVFVAAAVVLVMVGCSAPVRDARAALDSSRDALERIRAVIVAACVEPPVLPREQCDFGQDAFNDLAAAHSVLDGAVP